MDSNEDTALQPTGIEGAAVVFSGAAFVNVGLALGLLHFGWLGDVGAYRFLFFGLELAAAGVTVAAVALTLGPHRGAAARRAWRAGGASLLLVAVAMAWLIPFLLRPTAV